MDALVAAGAASRDARREPGDDGGPVRVVLLPTAVARHRPDLAAAHGRRAFEAAGQRLGIRVSVDVAPVFDRDAASSPGSGRLLEAADVIHLPGGDPDLPPAVLRGTPAWASVLRAYARGACVAGASAGAMALAARLWTPDGPVDGLALVPGIAVLPHFDPGRASAWRRAVDPDGRLGGSWTVAGTGLVHVMPPGVADPVDAVAHGGSLHLPVG
jgi:cyanophycinase-like exopeptidase